MRLLVPQLRIAGMMLTGTPRYISPSVFIDDFDKISMGDRVVISSHVSLLTHDYSLTTMMIAASEHDNGGDVAIVRPIAIGNNVFIGRGSIIMPGAVLGDNVIVGAGSVVRGSFQSGAVIIGNPAQVVGTISEQYERFRQKDAVDVRKDTAW